MSYQSVVQGDNPYLYYRLQETSGTTATDAMGNDTGTYLGTVTLAQQTPPCDTYSAYLDGSTGWIETAKSVTEASTNPYSQEAWFNTTSTGGLLFALTGNQSGAISGGYDRYLYINSSGQLQMVTYAGANKIVTSAQSYNDGKWHHVVATNDGTTMILYVDGVQVGSLSYSNQEVLTGYWRIGALLGKTAPNTTNTNNYFKGYLSNLAIYNSILTSTQVQNHYNAATGGSTGTTYSGAGTAQGTSTVSSTETTIQSASGIVTAQSTVTSSETFVQHSGTTYSASGTATGTSTVSATEHYTFSETDSIQGSSTVSSSEVFVTHTGTTYSGSGSVTAQSTVTATDHVIQTTSGTVQGTSNVSATEKTVYPVSGSINGQSTVTSSENLISHTGTTYSASGAINCSSTVSGNEQIVYLGRAIIMGLSTTQSSDVVVYETTGTANGYAVVTVLNGTKIIGTIQLKGQRDLYVYIKGQRDLTINLKGQL